MKSYLYLAFFFMVMTYLTPKEQYRRYFRFVLGVFFGGHYSKASCGRV